jgi:thiol-disulfide isomerase/thioredoxin
MNKKTTYLAIFVIAAVALAVFAYFNFSAPQTSSNFNSLIGQPVPQSVLSEMNVPSNVSNRIGAGSVSNPPFNVNSSPLVNGTKPVILYVGADYCPFCAITRWGLIIAMLRFGNFSNLHYTASNSSDVYPNSPTFSFYNSTYRSSYVSFVGVEVAARSMYQVLQKPTTFQNGLFVEYNPGGGIPFIDFANVSIQSGAPADPQVLQGFSWGTIIANLTVTNSSVSQALVGTADVYTAEICRITNFTPASVCSQPYVGKLLKTFK